MGAFRGTQPFLQNQSWQNQAINALHYNTSQVGSVIALIYGTCRQQVNLIALGRFSGPSGKKGKQGTLPLTGTNTTRLGGKGGGGGKGSGKKSGTGKKSKDFNIEVDFGLCHGPIPFPNNNLVFANAGVETFNAAQAHFYDGSDGQAPDPVFLSRGITAGYSGTCHVTFTPMDLGSTPALPNLSFELNGFETGTAGPNFPVDANPGSAINDFLTNPRYGCGFPAANLDQILPVGSNTYGDYCQAAQFAISTSLDGQQKAAEWLDGIAKLTNTAIVWSGDILRFVPYGDLPLAQNGASWTPNLVPVYSLTDDHFLPWHPHEDGSGPTPGDDDPVLITRTNPADAVNSIEIEYTERNNFYNATMIPVFDQSAIDIYGLRSGENMPGKAFCNSTSAQISAQVYLQRLLYIRNYYKFKLGWQFCRLEPMDIVLLTDVVAGLNQQAVRITSIEEDENGDLTIEAEELSTGTAAPPPTPPVIMAAYASGGGLDPTGTRAMPFTGGPVTIDAGLNTPGPGIIMCCVFNHQTAQLEPGPQFPAGPQIPGSRLTGPPTSTSGLTFARRVNPYIITDPGPGGCGTFPPCFGCIELWWAAAPNPLTNEFVTINLINGVVASFVNAMWIAAPGLNIFSPFDTNPSLPATFQDNSGNPGVATVPGVSTDSPLSLIFTYGAEFSVLGQAIDYAGNTFLSLSNTASPIVPGSAYFAGGGQAFQVFDGYSFFSGLHIAPYTGQQFNITVPTNGVTTIVDWFVVADALALQ